MKEIDLKIKKIFKENLHTNQEIKDSDLEKPIKYMSLVDSLSILNIIEALENEFNVSFEMEDLDNIFYDINSVKEYIIKNKKG